MVVFHYTDMPSASEALKWMINPTSQVSAHYLIDEQGEVIPLVTEEKRAWHAGQSSWQGKSSLNNCSIGIELANPGHTHGYLPFPEPQIESLIKLCEGIQKRWDIPSNRFLGHSDIAPQRKQDPGHLFPWEALAKEGFGIWPGLFGRHCEEGKGPDEATHDQAHFSGLPRPSGPRNDEENVIRLLDVIGYDVTSPSDTLRAFQRHFQPHKVDGVSDKETVQLLEKVLQLS